MDTDLCNTPGWRPERSRQRRFRFFGLGLLAGWMVCGSGCGADRSGRDGDTRSHVNVILATRLGGVVAQDAEPGEVVLVHLSSVPGEAAQWMEGLGAGLGKEFSVTELGPEELPKAAQYGMGGKTALQYAIRQYPNARAVITTLPVGASERPAFPKNHPPLFALNWDYLPDSIHMFKRGYLVAGVFGRPYPDTSDPIDPARSPDEFFDRYYVIATSQNIRTLLAEY